MNCHVAALLILKMDSDLTAIEDIRSELHEKTLTLVEIKAKTKCYKRGIEKLRDEIENTEILNSNLNKDINQVKILNDKLLQVYKSAKETLNVCHSSKLYVALYNRYTESQLNEVSAKQNGILKQYSKQYDDTREQLQKSSPLYKELQECKIKLKLSKFNCLDLEQKIMMIKKIQRQSGEIKQRIFCNDIIRFVKNWLNYNKYTKALATLEEYKQYERQCLRELLEAQETAKKTGISKYSSINTKKNVDSVKDPEKPVTESGNTLSQQMYLFKKSLETPVVFKQPMVSMQFSQNNTKVRIIDDVIMSKATSNTLLPRTNSKKDLKSEAAKANKDLEKIFNKYSKRLSRLNSSSSVSSGIKCQNRYPTNSQDSASSQKSFYASQHSEFVPSPINVTEPTVNTAPINKMVIGNQRVDSHSNNYVKVNPRGDIKSQHMVLEEYRNRFDNTENCNSQRMDRFENSQNTIQSQNDVHMSNLSQANTFNNIPVAKTNDYQGPDSSKELPRNVQPFSMPNDHISQNIQKMNYSVNPVHSFGNSKKNDENVSSFFTKKDEQFFNWNNQSDSQNPAEHHAVPFNEGAFKKPAVPDYYSNFLDPNSFQMQNGSNLMGENINSSLDAQDISFNASYVEAENIGNMETNMMQNTNELPFSFGSRFGSFF